MNRATRAPAGSSQRNVGYAFSSRIYDIGSYGILARAATTNDAQMMPLTEKDTRREMRSAAQRSDPRFAAVRRLIGQRLLVSHRHDPPISCSGHQVVASRRCHHSHRLIAQILKNIVNTNTGISFTNALGWRGRCREPRKGQKLRRSRTSIQMILVRTSRPAPTPRNDTKIL